MDSDAEEFLGGVKSVGIPPSRLKGILLTHWHNEHSASAAFLKSKFNVPVYYAEGDRPYLPRQTATKGMRGGLGKHVPEEGVLVLLRGLLEEAAPEVVTANHLVTYGESIEGSFRVITTPGHMDGHVAYVHKPPCSVATRSQSWRIARA